MQAALTATLAPEFNRFTSPPMQPRVKTIRMILLVLFLLPIVARAILFAATEHPPSWRDADWSSTGMLPPAASDPPVS